MMAEYAVGDRAPVRLSVRSETEIRSNWKYIGPPLVSVYCPTYNHVNFIEDAISGFLGQETDFPFEVIVRDDASTDGTADVVRRFAESHPGIVKALIERENTYQTVRAVEIVRQNLRGTYTAYCDGDDYWIDPRKLQNQVNLMRSNPNISLVATRALSIENDVIIALGEGNGGTRTYLTEPIPDYPVHRHRYINFGDVFLYAVKSAKGEVVVLPEVTAVWRKHAGGAWSSLLDTDITLLEFQRGLTQFWLSEYFLKKGDVERARMHLIYSINKMIAAYPSLSRGVRSRAVLQWFAPKWAYRAFRFLGRKAKSLF